MDEQAPLVGEAMAEGEEIEHAQRGQSDKAWDKDGPHRPADDKKDGGTRP